MFFSRLCLDWCVACDYVFILTGPYWPAGFVFFFFQAEDGIRDLVRSRGLGDVYKRQSLNALGVTRLITIGGDDTAFSALKLEQRAAGRLQVCLLYTSDAADERSSVDLGGRRIIKKKKISTSGLEMSNKNELTR